MPARPDPRRDLAHERRSQADDDRQRQQGRAGRDRGRGKQAGADRIPRAIHQLQLGQPGLAGKTQALISVDTRKPGVARRAIEAGASIVNDTTSATLADQATHDGAVDADELQVATDVELDASCRHRADPPHQRVGVDVR